ncbi:hypothetical protein BGZ80_003300 [Entomortierella chlamydospora]|uniref:L-tryptophan decarboxylase PsiD-like domain-containing protein n=1 Tax=Entomortierella chlamydospora TaxID=101097 RepID=A0A9P6MNC6_9FUNG|nr:hypothetical protein BGZ79_009300 [Entomortierella chlamydospora]KAG0008561.1 hypothetical protein BGZ80_003300 [Entomortierella chlamydospora]
MPKDHRIHRDWLAGIIKDVDASTKPLHPVIQEFQQMIETNPRVYMLLESMFEEVPHKEPYNKDPIGRPEIRDYRHFLRVLNHLLTTAPSWSDKSERMGLVGVPINALLDWPMGTPSGHAAFLDPEINAMLKKVLEAWSDYLKSPASAYVLNDSPTDWFGPSGHKEVAAVANVGANTGQQQQPLSFEELFVCDPSAPHHGYSSWDNYFTRQFREGVRPIASPNDNNVIVNACESKPYCIQHNVKARDKFWLKHQPYSILDMLAHDEQFADQFIGGTVFQAFLSALSYHRWHAPVSGRIVKAYVVDGTYFSEPLFEGIGDPANRNQEINVKTLDPSQGYLSATATRALIFIQADNPAIGLMVFMGIGMTEVSTCDITVRVGDHVKKGDEIGMFHFGGSTYCMVFRKGVHLSELPATDMDENVPVLSKLAVVHP